MLRNHQALSRAIPPQQYGLDGMRRKIKDFYPDDDARSLTVSV
jgi:hypothetical protein